MVLVDSARGWVKKEGKTKMAESKKGGRKEGAGSDRKFSNIFLAKVNQERWRCAAYAETAHSIPLSASVPLPIFVRPAWNESPKAWESIIC